MYNIGLVMNRISGRATLWTVTLVYVFPSSIYQIQEKYVMLKDT